MAMKSESGKLVPTFEAMKALGVSPGTLRNLIRAGRLTGFSTRANGRANWITRASFERLVKELGR